MKETDKLSSGRLPISKRMVYAAYQQVKTGGKSPGVDHQSLLDYQQDLCNNLYKLWNRLSSGSYYPKPVKGKQIPKKNGKFRLLGIPTIEDRIAQTVLKNMIEPQCESMFVEDSYGYRPKKSALEALSTVRKRVWNTPWVLELDIEKFFDELDHVKLHQILNHIGLSNWKKVYIERWLKCPMAVESGEIIARDKGTPQGGVISPLLANLFLGFLPRAGVEIKNI